MELRKSVSSAGNRTDAVALRLRYTSRFKLVGSHIIRGHGDLGNHHRCGRESLHAQETQGQQMAQLQEQTSHGWQGK